MADATTIPPVGATPASPSVRSIESRHAAAHPRRGRRPYKLVAGIAVRYAAMIALSAVFVLPFVWMVGTSLTSADLVLNRDRPLFPAHPVWANYWRALVGVGLPFGTFLQN